MGNLCSIDGCDLPVFIKKRALCRMHYHRWYRTGDPTKAAYARANGTPIERWWAKVEKTDQCWLWTGGLDRRGYGQFDVIRDGEHKNFRAHRWGYQQIVRSLADDETLDHLCRNHRCVRPEHLEPVPHAENVRRGLAGTNNSSKTHCPQGHPYEGDNLIKKARGRDCRTCHRIQSRDSSRRSRGKTENVIPNEQKTHCPKGHPYDDVNTYRTSRGGRQCRICTRAAVRESMRRKRAADKENPQ